VILSQEENSIDSDDKVVDHNTNMICQGYLSDLLSEGEDINYAGDEDNSASNLDAASKPINPSSMGTPSSSLSPLPKRKWRKVDISACTA
jgi:hypothetical protein